MIAARIARFHTSDLIKARLAFLEAKEQVLSKAVNTPPRPAYYCSGCPHNTSTKVPQGSLALAGIGCHVMATAIYPEFNRSVRFNTLGEEVVRRLLNAAVWSNHYAQAKKNGGI